VKICVEDVFARDPVAKEADDAGLNYH
jgi:hypothetical protein